MMIKNRVLSIIRSLKNGLLYLFLNPTFVAVLASILAISVLINNKVSATPKISSVVSEYSQLLEYYGIDTPNRKAHFLAQMAYETWGFLLFTELISDEYAEKLYGADTKLGRLLGNTKIGDGAKYKGRGWIMLTGRSNYQKYGDLIGEDLINNPELAAISANAWLIAILYWKENGLNELADSHNIAGITIKVSGSLNSLDERKNWFKKFE